MISLDFQLNKRYLAYHTLVNCSPGRFVNGIPDEKIVSFQNAVWVKDEAAYNYLRYGVDELSFFVPPSFLELATRADTLLEESLSETTFAPLLHETSDSLTLVKTEWESNLTQSYDWISDLTGLDLNASFQVFITHPALKQGHYLRQAKGICWAHRQPWPNYNTVYLWHELLHSFIPGEPLEHALIQFLTDNELRVRFNGGSYPAFEGHPHLFPLMDALLPRWREYLKRENKSIHELIVELAADSKVQSEIEKAKDK